MSPASLDLGEMIEGESRRIEVQLNRPENTKIRIAGIKTSCPCLQFEPRKFIVEPHEDCTIVFNLHTLTMHGDETKKFYVELMAPKKLVLTGEIRATVKRVPAKLAVQPQAFHLGAVRGRTREAVKLYNLTKRDLPLEPPVCKIPGALVFYGDDAKHIPAGEYVEVVLVVDADKLETAGPLKSTVEIKTGQPAHALVAIPVDGTVQK